MFKKMNVWKVAEVGLFILGLGVTIAESIISDKQQEQYIDEAVAKALANQSK